MADVMHKIDHRSRDAHSFLAVNLRSTVKHCRDIANTRKSETVARSCHQ